MIENMSTKLNEYKNCLNSIRSSDQHQNESSKEISKTIDILDNEIKEYEKRLFNYKTIEYEPIESIMELEDMFGKLLVSRNKLFFLIFN